MTIRDLLEKTEQYAVEIINGRQETRYDRAFRIFLAMLSHLYRIAVQFRVSLYMKSLLERQNLGSFVVSVGNLTVGGTGKTPVVELLARELAVHGRKIAILSRGYRSKSRTWREKLKSFFMQREYRLPPKVVSDGTHVLLDSQQSGDEPYMLARNLVASPTAKNIPGVAVVVDKDRVHGGRYAIRKFGADTLLLDDGFQYMPLRPRINIVLVDTTNPFHNHELLPFGLLREPIENIMRADYIFMTKSNGAPSLRRLRMFLERHNPRALIIECNHVPTHLQEVYGSEILPLEALSGKRVAAVCGIAVPGSFENYLTDLGAEIVHRQRYVDHHRYRRQEIAEFAEAAKKAGAEMLLTTEKDAVRIPKANTYGIPFYFLRVEIQILSGREHFDACIQSICMK